MEIFSVFEHNTNSQAQSSRKTQKGKSKGRPPKQNLSPDEIREKVRKHFDAKKNPDAKVEISGKAEKAAKKDKKVSAEAKPNSDIKDNSPDSDMTKNKLRDALATGAFAWNDKEKEVLAKILGQ